MTALSYESTLRNAMCGILKTCANFSAEMYNTVYIQFDLQMMNVYVIY